MTDDDDTYQVTEGDAAWMQEYMRLNHNKKITHEQAVKILQRVAARQKVLEHFDPKVIEEELQDLEDY
jgi:phosphoribosyl 1,2-cyclic phosphodiesterase